MNKELLEKAKDAKSVEELCTLANENGIVMTEAEARNYFAQLNPENGELSDSELETVASGCGNSSVVVNKHTSSCPYCGASEDKTVCYGVDSEDMEGPFVRCAHFQCIQCNRSFQKPI